MEGLGSQIFEHDAVKFGAMKVSGVSGDARRILDVCRCVVLTFASVAVSYLQARRAVELIRSINAPAVKISHVKQVIEAMQSSPTAAYLRDCSLHEKIMLASLLKCVKRAGVDEIRWGDVCPNDKRCLSSLR